jgi:hypothetical protein
MKTAKHTSGPWKVETHKNSKKNETMTLVSTDYPEALCNGARSIAIMTGYHYTRPEIKGNEAAISENMANARLMAAAPDMFDALKAIVSGLTNGQRERGETLQTIAQAAIVKAAGPDVRAVYPTQCKCGHIFLEKYEFQTTAPEGYAGFCWCGFCKTKLMVKPSAH